MAEKGTDELVPVYVQVDDVGPVVRLGWVPMNDQRYGLMVLYRMAADRIEADYGPRPQPAAAQAAPNSERSP